MAVGETRGVRMFWCKPGAHADSVVFFLHRPCARAQGKMLEDLEEDVDGTSTRLASAQARASRAHS
jgi:hypothetical protein